MIKLKFTPHNLCFILLLLTGCTSYKKCYTLEAKQIARYEQNIILDEDPFYKATYKGVKHIFWDCVTFGFCEFWYDRIRTTYKTTTHYKIQKMKKDSNLKETEILSSFLGIRFGEPLPPTSLCFFDVKQVDTLVYSFNTNRKFSDNHEVYKFNVHITPDDRRVWKISAIADFSPSITSLKYAKEYDLQNPSRSYKSYTEGLVIGNQYSGVTTTYRCDSSVSDLYEHSSRKAAEEVTAVYVKLCERYGKASKYDRTLSFNNGMRISVLRTGDTDVHLNRVEISAYDESVKDKINRWMGEQKKKQKSDVRHVF